MSLSQTSLFISGRKSTPEVDNMSILMLILYFIDPESFLSIGSLIEEKIAEIGTHVNFISDFQNGVRMFEKEMKPGA